MLVLILCNSMTQFKEVLDFMNICLNNKWVLYIIVLCDMLCVYLFVYLALTRFLLSLCNHLVAYAYLYPFVPTVHTLYTWILGLILFFGGYTFLLVGRFLMLIHTYVFKVWSLSCIFVHVLHNCFRHLVPYLWCV